MTKWAWREFMAVKANTPPTSVDNAVEEYKSSLIALRNAMQDTDPAQLDKLSKQCNEVMVSLANVANALFGYKDAKAILNPEDLNDQNGVARFTKKIDEFINSANQELSNRYWDPNISTEEAQRYKQGQMLIDALKSGKTEMLQALEQVNSSIDKVAKEANVDPKSVNLSPIAISSFMRGFFKAASAAGQGLISGAKTGGSIAKGLLYATGGTDLGISAAIFGGAAMITLGVGGAVYGFTSSAAHSAKESGLELVYGKTERAKQIALQSIDQCLKGAGVNPKKIKHP